MSHDPTTGNPHVFWDETALFVPGGAIPVGGAFTLQMDSANTAAYYNIDVIDLETPPPPLAQPANSLSIMSYGAASNNPSFDNSTALQNCFNAGQSQGKIVWIPPGNFYISAGGALEPRSVTIQGAGPWYSTITCTKDNWANGFMIHAVSTSRLKTLAWKPPKTQQHSRHVCDPWPMAGGWIIDNVWSRPRDAGLGQQQLHRRQNSRVNNSWGDGMPSTMSSAGAAPMSSFTIIFPGATAMVCDCGDSASTDVPPVPEMRRCSTIPWLRGGPIKWAFMAA